MSITLRSGLSLASIAVSLILAGCDNGPESVEYPQNTPVNLSQTTELSTLAKNEASGDVVVKQGNLTAGEAAFIDPETKNAVTTIADLGGSQKAANGDSLVRRNDIRVPVYGENANRRSVAYMLHMSDVQVSDEESPGLTPTNDFVDFAGNFNNGLFQGSYRPHSPYLPHMAKELVLAANKVAADSKDFDIAIHTGDAIENAQANELAMFLNLLNGGDVVTDSNSGINPASADQVERSGDAAVANNTITSGGLLKRDGTTKAPWLSVVGNHDILGQGNFPLPLLAMFNDPGQFPLLQTVFAEIGVTIPNLTITPKLAGILQKLAEAKASTDDAVRATIPALAAAMQTELAEGRVAYRSALSTKQRYISTDANGADAIALTSGTLDLNNLVSWQQMLGIFKAYKDGSFAGTAKPQDVRRLPIDTCSFIRGHMNPAAVMPADLGFPAVNGSAVPNGFGPSNAGYNAQGALTENCHGNYTWDVNPAVRMITLNGANQFGGDAGVIDRPHMPYDLSKMSSDHPETQAATIAFSSPRENEAPLMVGSKPLFGVLAAQGRADDSLKGQPIDTVNFLKTELEKAKQENKLAIVATHQASEDLVPYNQLRALMEGIVCNVVDGEIAKAKAAAPDLNLDRLDCNPRGGSTGILSTSLGTLLNADAANEVSKDLFAKVLTGGAISQYSQLTQEVLNSRLVNLDGTPNETTGLIISGFSLLFNLRQVLPDPVEPLDTDHFRKLLASYDNVVLHLAGHSHKNEIIGICSNGIASHSDGQISDPKLGNLKSPGNYSCANNVNQFGKGYYEIRTAANADWPLEWRVVEMVDNNDGTLSIYTPVFGFDNETASAEAQLGRRLALTDMMTRGVVIDEKEGDRFTELLVNIPAEIDAALDEINKDGTAGDIQSLSSLVSKNAAE